MESGERPEHEIFESALLANNHDLLDKFEQDEEGVFLLAHQNTEGFTRLLLQLENDLNLFFAKDCVHNQGGRFLESVKGLVSDLLYKRKIPDQSRTVLERILNIILDFYSAKNNQDPKL